MPGVALPDELTIPILVAKTGIPPDVLRKQRYSDLYLLTTYYEALKIKNSNANSGGGKTLKNPDFN